MTELLSVDSIKRKSTCPSWRWFGWKTTVWLSKLFLPNLMAFPVVDHWQTKTVLKYLKAKSITFR
jgi:hypothetical protein